MTVARVVAKGSQPGSQVTLELDSDGTWTSQERPDFAARMTARGIPSEPWRGDPVYEAARTVASLTGGEITFLAPSPEYPEDAIF